MPGGLLGIVGSVGPVGYNPFGGFMVYKPSSDEVYLVELSVSGGGADGIKRFTVRTSGTENFQQLEADMGLGDVLSDTMCYHPNLDQLFAAMGTSNCRPVSRISADTIVQVEVYGVANAYLGPSTIGPPVKIIASAQFLPVWNASQSLLASAAIVTPEVCCIDVTSVPMILTSYVENVLEAHARLGPGTNGAECVFYAIGYGSFPSSTALSLYQYEASGAVVRSTLRTIVPTQVDPAWTNFGDFNGPGFDSSDGGILCFFQTNDAVTNQQYLVKFSPLAGDILWKLPVSLYDLLDMQQSLFPGQMICQNLITTNFIAIVNLKDGTVDEVEYNHGLSTVQQQIFAKQSVMAVLDSGSYAQGAGPVPEYLGAYLAANANVLPVHRQGRVWPGTPEGQRTYVEVI